MRLSKERRELIGTVASELSCEKQIISVVQIIDRVNETSDKPTSEEEVLHGLRRFIATTPKSTLQFGLYEESHVFHCSVNKKDVPALIDGTGKNQAATPNEPVATTEEAVVEVDSAIDPDVNKDVLIGIYAETAVSFYGLISFADLAAVINHYKADAFVTAEDVAKGIEVHRGISQEEVEYTIFEELVVSPYVLSNFPEEGDIDVDLVRHIANLQADVDRYLPDHETFMSYHDQGAHLDTEAMTAFGQFIAATEGMFEGDEELLANVLFSFSSYLRAGLTLEMWLRFFDEQGFKFANEQVTEQFLGHVVDVYNTSRLFALNGQTPAEAGKAMGKDFSLMMSKGKKPVKQRVANNVGRNDPCPCASGKKYKKCCG